MLSSNDAAAQHKPRPLPLFLDMVHNETQHEPDRLAAALAGLRAYQAAPRAQRPASMPIVARAGRAKLLDYGGSGRPLIVIPSLINGCEVLDLLPDASMLRWLAARNVRPLLVDWGIPSPDERALSIAGHVEQMLLPLIESIGKDAALAGYCLGGTMALAAAAIRPPRALALIAAPWRFTGYNEEARAGLGDLWQVVRPTAEALGLLPLEVLQAGFWKLDPKRTVEKFVSFGAATRDEAAIRLFVALEDWANDGPPLTLAVGRDLLEEFVGADRPGSSTWTVDGRPIDPARITCPVLDIVSTTDRIVPAATAVGPMLPHAETLTLGLGHVGMMVGGRARDSLWAPLANWLTGPHIA